MLLGRLGTRSIDLHRPLRRTHGILSAVVLLLSGCGLPSRSSIPPLPLPTAPKALDRQTIIELHKGVPPQRGVTPKRLIYLARTECLSFFITPEIEADWRREGMDDEVVEELKSVCVNLRNTEEERVRQALERELQRQFGRDIGSNRAAEQYYAAANAYMNAERYGAAEGEIWQAIRAAPASPRRGAYYFLLGMSYYHQRKCDTALRAFESSTQLDRSRDTGYRAFAHAGHCFQLGREWDKARDAYQRAYDHTPPAGQREWLDARVAELPGRAP
jgi:tetratricopeptide (TPR) repeat protein